MRGHLTVVTCYAVVLAAAIGLGALVIAHALREITKVFPQ